MGKKTASLVASIILTLTGLMALAQDASQWLPSPYNAAPYAISDQQRDNSQIQRLSPRNRLFLSPIGQPQRYDAVTINRYLIGYPGTDYRIRPMVRTPMYQSPGQ